MIYVEAGGRNDSSPVFLSAINFRFHPEMKNAAFSGAGTRQSAYLLFDLFQTDRQATIMPPTNTAIQLLDQSFAIRPHTTMTPTESMQMIGISFLISMKTSSFVKHETIIF